MADELRLIRADWGPPIEATLTVTGRRVHALVHEKVARPRLRPVVLTGGEAAGGPVRWTVWPDGSGRNEDAGDPT